MPMGTGRPLVALPRLDLLFAEAAWAFHSPCEAGKEILAPPGLLSIDPPLPQQTVPSTDGPPTSWQHLSPVVVGCVVVPPAGRTFVRPMESPLPKSRWGQAVGSSLPQLQGNLDRKPRVPPTLDQRSETQPPRGTNFSTGSINPVRVGQ